MFFGDTKLRINEIDPLMDICFRLECADTVYRLLQEFIKIDIRLNNYSTYGEDEYTILENFLFFLNSSYMPQDFHHLQYKTKFTFLPLLYGVLQKIYLYYNTDNQINQQEGPQYMYDALEFEHFVTSCCRNIEFLNQE